MRFILAEESLGLNQDFVPAAFSVALLGRACYVAPQ
jgi:hypothetical protein